MPLLRDSKSTKKLLRHCYRRSLYIKDGKKTNNIILSTNNTIILCKQNIYNH